MTYFAAFVLAFFVAALLIPIVRRKALHEGWVDGPNARKIHSGEIPRLGGIGIAAGFFIATALMWIFLTAIHASIAITPTLYAMLFGALGFHVLGLWDDFHNLRARFKFAIQLAIALAVVATGYHFDRIVLPGIVSVQLGLWGYALTAVWIVGMANAMNLIDGLDGLAGGVAFIAAAVWGILLFKSGLFTEGMIAAAIGGAVFGFLFFNFPPANIFMGDSGSLLLGYMVAMLPLLGNERTSGGMQLVPGITVALIPILDTFAAILRRSGKGTSFFSPDKAHMHHKLLDLGFSPRDILIIIYGLCIILGASVLASVYASPEVSLWFMLGGWVVSGGGFVVLHFVNKSERKGDK